MYYDKDTEAKVCGQQAANGGLNQVQTKEWTTADEKEKFAYYHQEQANKAWQATSFLRVNPAFDEFMKLIRSGALQF